VREDFYRSAPCVAILSCNFPIARARRWISERKQKTRTMRDTVAADIVVAFLLSNDAVQAHRPEFGGGTSGETVLEAGACVVSTCAGV
jgi:hypothetical protein